MVLDQIRYRNVGNGGYLPRVVELDLCQDALAGLTGDSPMSGGARAWTRDRNRVLAHLGAKPAAVYGLVPFTDAEQLDILGKIADQLFRIGAVADPVFSPAPIPRNHPRVLAASSNTVSKGFDDFAHDLPALTPGAAWTRAGIPMRVSNWSDSLTS